MANDHDRRAFENLRAILFAAVLLAMLRPQIGRAEGETHPKSSVPRGEFSIGKDGRFILLPIELSGRTFQFLVDTGACVSAFDESLRSRLGQPHGVRLLQTPAGRKRVETFGWPETRLGGLPLKCEHPIVCVDLENVRQATNAPIFGVLGMDLLGQCLLQIDFDRGKLRFLESLPPATDDLGDENPIQFNEDGTPFLTGALPGDFADRFLIDTGAQGNSLDAEIFDELLKRNLIRTGISFASVTVGGNVRGQRGKLKSLSVGRFEHAGLRFSRVNVNSLGLRYLSRFRVTFDFPGRRAFLQKSAGHSKTEPTATSGLALVWVEGKAVVESVVKDGPAQIARLEPRDVLVKINGRKAELYDRFSLRELLTSEGGRRVQMTIRRGGRERDVEIVLADD